MKLDASAKIVEIQFRVAVILASSNLKKTERVIPTPNHAIINCTISHFSRRNCYLSDPGPIIFCLDSRSFSNDFAEQS